MKKILAVVLTIVMLFSVMSFGASAYTINKDDAEIGAGDIFGNTAVYFEDATVKKGETVTVDLIIESNPGITSVAIAFDLPEGIAIESVANGDMGSAVLENNTVTVSSANVMTEDGCLAKVTLKANRVGSMTIALTATSQNDGDAVAVNGSSCAVTVNDVEEVVAGDVNGDGKMDTTDLAVLKIFLANNERTEDVVNPDINGDGLENTTDLAALKLMLAGL